jgi:hypothetical protein
VGNDLASLALHEPGRVALPRSLFSSIKAAQQRRPTGICNDLWHRFVSNLWRFTALHWGRSKKIFFLGCPHSRKHPELALFGFLTRKKVEKVIMKQ